MPTTMTQQELTELIEKQRKQREKHSGRAGCYLHRETRVNELAAVCRTF